jgi:ABC-type Mn2+/Zn2+ transport system ATPase subunit
VLREVDLDVPEGASLGIIGPNGCGKTTLLKAILGLLRPRAGTLEYARTPPPRMGYIQQRQFIDDLFPLTVEEIVLMGRLRGARPFRRYRAEDRLAAVEALQTTGVSHLADRLYRNLSGGQKQRCLLARALASEPELLALDEPTNDMDIAGEESTLRLVSRIGEERRLTVVMISHRLDAVVNFVDHLALVRDGSLEVGPLEEILTSKRLGEFFGLAVSVARIEERYVIVPERGEGARTGAAE